MPVEEITSESSHQDIESYADQVAKEVEAERAGEKKSDAQITAEHVENEHVVEKKSDDEESAEKEGEGRDWLDDDLKGEVAAYGIEESELADFASREELERALRLFDKSALESGRKALAETEKPDEGETRNEKGQFKKKPEPEVKPAREGQYEIALSKDVYDEALVDEFTKLRDHYEGRREELESRFMALDDRFLESDARAEEQQFDNLVDSLGHADLFGKSDEEDAKQLQRRKDLHVAVKAQMLGLAQLGRPTELSEFLVNRVARMVFAEDISKKELKNHTRKITRQSNSRQGGGATRPQDPRDDPRDEADRLYKEMERA